MKWPWVFLYVLSFSSISDLLFLSKCSVLPCKPLHLVFFCPPWRLCQIPSLFLSPSHLFHVPGICPGLLAYNQREAINQKLHFLHASQQTYSHKRILFTFPPTEVEGGLALKLLKYVSCFC